MRDALAFLTLFVAKNKQVSKSISSIFFLFLSSFFYFFSVFWILPSSDTSISWKVKKGLGMNFLLCNFDTLVFCWGGRATFYLFGVAEANEVLAECYSGYSRRGAWSLVSGKDLGWTVSNFLTNSFFYILHSFYEILLIWLVRIYQNFRGQRVSYSDERPSRGFL